MTTTRARQFPLLRVNERVQLAPGGPLYRVARVNACAAYLKLVNVAPVAVTIGDRTFLAREGGALLAIAPRAAVYRVEGVSL